MCTAILDSVTQPYFMLHVWLTQHTEGILYIKMRPLGGAIG